MYYHPCSVTGFTIFNIPVFYLDRTIVSPDLQLHLNYFGFPVGVTITKVTSQYPNPISNGNEELSQQIENLKLADTSMTSNSQTPPQTPKSSKLPNSITSTPTSSRAASQSSHSRDSAILDYGKSLGRIV